MITKEATLFLTVSTAFVKNVSKASPYKTPFAMFMKIYMYYMYIIWKLFKDENCAKDNGKVDVTLSMISNVEKNAVTLAFFLFVGTIIKQSEKFQLDDFGKKDK